MNKNFLPLITILIFISCTSTKIGTEKRCVSVLKNDYRNIREEKFKSVVKNDTILLNEVKYECVYTSFYIQKGMYDKFGKWNKEIYPNGTHDPILVWNNVQIFPNDTTEFTVAANGIESVETIYASVLVFDKHNNDLLAESSIYKTKLIQYFSEMIKSDSNKKRDFYEIYWKTVDLKRLENTKN